MLSQCHRILKKNGLLIIADEVLPESILKRILYYGMKIPLAVVTFLLAQATTRSVKGLAGKLDGTGFNIISRRKQFNDAFETIIAQKGEDENK